MRNDDPSGWRPTDAELMRVRRVRVVLRFAASNPLLRIPDLTVAVDVAPANAGGA